MARININEFSGRAGGMASRVDQVRTDPAVVKAAQNAWGTSGTPAVPAASWPRRSTPPGSVRARRPHSPVGTALFKPSGRLTTGRGTPQPPDPYAAAGRPRRHRRDGGASAKSEDV